MKALARSLPITRVLATGLRMGAMGTRLVGLIVLARFVTPDTYGQFALSMVTAAFAAYLLGAELYTRTIFKLSRTEVSNWGSFVSRQYVAISYILLVFWLAAVAVYFVSGEKLVLWIAALATADVANQENNRLLVISKNHVFASAMLFFRQAIWIVATFALLNGLFLEDETNLVLSAWLGAGLLTATVSFLRLEAIGVKIRPTKLSGNLVLRFLQASALMLISGIALRGLISLDKIILGLSDSYNLLAAYTFFATLAFGLVPILENAVFIYLMPNLVGAAVERDWTSFRNQLVKATWMSAGILLVYVLLATALIDNMLQWVGRSYYSESKDIFFILLASSGLYNFAMISYYGIYALQNKKLLLQVNITAVVLCQIVYALLYFVDIPIAMPISLLLTMTFLCASQYFFLKRLYTNQEILS